MVEKQKGRLTKEDIIATYWEALALGSPEGQRMAQKLKGTAGKLGIDLGESQGDRGSGVVGSHTKRAAGGIR